MNLKKIIVLVMIVINTIVFGENLNDLSDDFVIADIDEVKINTADLKMYLLGYSTVKKWDADMINVIVDGMIVDTLFKRASDNDGIKIAESEMQYFVESFFRQVGIDPEKNPEKVKFYFDNSDPYYDISDLIFKNHFMLVKAKYLFKHGYVKSVKAAHIYFSTKGLDNDEKLKVKQEAMQVANNVSAGMDNFNNFVLSYSDDSDSRLKWGDMGVINYNKKNNFYSKKEINKLFDAGLFSPVFLESKKGYGIVMNYSYMLVEDNVTLKLVDNLRNEYPVKKFIKF